VVFIVGEGVYGSENVENELNLLFRLSPNVWYLGAKFGVLLHSASRVIC
jgi:hypothetical protein